MTTQTIEEITLTSGEHIQRNEGMCLMEAVAYVAGEPHSWKPSCACPVISEFASIVNDGIDNDYRDGLLKPLIPLLVGTATEDRELLSARAMHILTSVVKLLPMVIRAYDGGEQATKMVSEIEQLEPEWFEDIQEFMGPWRRTPFDSHMPAVIAESIENASMGFAHIFGDPDRPWDSMDTWLTDAMLDTTSIFDWIYIEGVDLTAFYTRMAEIIREALEVKTA